MKKKKTVIWVGVIAVLLVVGLVVSTQTDLMQGFMVKRQSKLVDVQKVPKFFLHKGKIVSLVTSPVSSVVVSNVTSPAATSKVPSVVTSPVASAVLVPPNINTGGDKPPTLTNSFLESAAKEEFKKNPSKFVLPVSEKKRILEMFKQSKTL